jgi:indole-3-acetate monooxygenase
MLSAMTGLVTRARELAQELPSHRPVHDNSRQLAPQVVESLRSTKILGALVPAELGGAELSPVDYIDLLETLAAGDSATAWCVMTASTSTLLAAYLARETAESLWATAPLFVAGVFAPGGKLGPDGRLSGKWSWASGSRHAEWFAVGAIAEKRHVVCFVPASSVRIVDNWDTLGLAGTGSHDIVIENVAVPASHVTSVFGRAPWAAGALYKVPLFGLLATGIAACALGVAKAALAHAAGKLTAESGSAVLSAYAEQRAELASARAYLVATAGTASARATSEANASHGSAGARSTPEGSAQSIDDATRGELRLAASFATHRAAAVVRAAFHLGGGTSVRAGSPLGDALRDIETMLTHRMVTERMWPAAARAVLGLGVTAPDL